MMQDLLIALAVYLLVGWWDAAYVHYQTYGRWTWKWVALAWPIRLWLDLVDPRPAVPQWPLNDWWYGEATDEDSPHACPRCGELYGKDFEAADCECNHGD